MRVRIHAKLRTAKIIIITPFDVYTINNTITNRPGCCSAVVVLQHYNQVRNYTDHGLEKIKSHRKQNNYKHITTSSRHRGRPNFFHDRLFCALPTPEAFCPPSPCRRRRSGLCNAPNVATTVSSKKKNAMPPFCIFVIARV